MDPMNKFFVQDPPYLFESVLQSFIANAKEGDVEALIEITSDKTVSLLDGAEGMKEHYLKDTIPSFKRCEFLPSAVVIHVTKRETGTGSGWVYQQECSYDAGKTITIQFVILNESGRIVVASVSPLSSTQNNITSYESAGNLESPKPSGCVQINSITNQQNPVDIFTGLNKCLTDGSYSQAAHLYLTGMSYGYYDTKRVSDRTAHQAISVLRMNIFSTHTTESLALLQTEVTKLTTNNSELCSSLNKLGKPTYKPTYMIQHGMSAFTGQSTKDGLVENFDSQQAWKDSISKIAKCV
jgi:hypothetical protein